MALNNRDDCSTRLRWLAGDMLDALDGKPVFQRHPTTGEFQHGIPVTVQDLAKRIGVEVDLLHYAR